MRWICTECLEGKAPTVTIPLLKREELIAARAGLPYAKTESRAPVVISHEKTERACTLHGRGPNMVDATGDWRCGTSPTRGNNDRTVRGTALTFYHGEVGADDVGGTTQTGGWYQVILWCKTDKRSRDHIMFWMRKHGTGLEMHDLDNGTREGAIAEGRMPDKPEGGWGRTTRFLVRGNLEQGVTMMLEKDDATTGGFIIEASEVMNVRVPTSGMGAGDMPIRSRKLAPDEVGKVKPGEEVETAVLPLPTDRLSRGEKAELAEGLALVNDVKFAALRAQKEAEGLKPLDLEASLRDTKAAIEAADPAKAPEWKGDKTGPAWIGGN